MALVALSMHFLIPAESHGWKWGGLLSQHPMIFLGIQRRIASEIWTFLKLLWPDFTNNTLDKVKNIGELGIVKVELR
jgi:hypothetical protein